ncbi:unnamed protein product, partial [Mesorhabditis belari]|uniref:Uncharacterized protein n=1 Tax=Mesorhabditis belari TaxID=2138241 RepID=A0AAF3FJY7_9BILA
MPKQDFDTLDYMGPVVVGVLFTVFLFLVSFLFINFFCITKHDDVTAFERIAARHNMRMGPHSLAVVKRGNFYEEDESYVSEA